MKAMTCRQLAGACDRELQAESFEEVAELNKQHGMAMHRQQDPAHLEAMRQMQVLMQSPEEMKRSFEATRQEFEALPDV